MKTKRSEQTLCRGRDGGGELGGEFSGNVGTVAKMRVTREKNKGGGSYAQSEDTENATGVGRKKRGREKGRTW